MYCHTWLRFLSLSCLPSPACCLQEFAGELLALAGPLEPSAIAFDPAAAFSSAHKGASSASVPGTGGAGAGSGRTQGTQNSPAEGASKGGKGMRARASPASKAAGGGPSGTATWVVALQLLGDYLVDESVEVIKSAQYTLRLLLATPEGLGALQQLDPGLRPYLEAFQHSGSPSVAHPCAAVPGAAGTGAGSAAAQDGRLQLDSPQLWCCDAQPYDTWVCNLTCAMLRQVRLLLEGRCWVNLLLLCGVLRASRVLPACPTPLVGCNPCLPLPLLALQTSSATLINCQRMAQCKPAFAELLLPHAFADLALQPSATLSLQLGSLITQQLLPRLHHHPKAARLLLSCLNHLRSQYLDAKLAGGGAAAPAAKGGSKAKAAVAGATPGLEAELWRKVCCCLLLCLATCQAAILPSSAGTASSSH